jgi:hypothetical protein
MISTCTTTNGSGHFRPLDSEKAHGSVLECGSTREHIVPVALHRARRHSAPGKPGPVQYGQHHLASNQTAQLCWVSKHFLNETGPESGCRLDGSRRLSFWTRRHSWERILPRPEAHAIPCPAPCRSIRAGAALRRNWTGLDRQTVEVAVPRCLSSSRTTMQNCLCSGPR